MFPLQGEHIHRLLLLGLIALTIVTNTNETGYDVWNTITGADSIPSTSEQGVRNYWPGEMPNYAFDNKTNTKYIIFGTYMLNETTMTPACNKNAGLYLTPRRGPFTLLSL